MQEQDYAALAPHSYQRETAHSDPQAFNWQLSGESLKLASPKDSTIDHSGSNRFLDQRRVSGNPWAAAKSKQVWNCCIPTIPTCPPSFTKGWCRSALWLICKSSPAAFFLRFILIGSILGLPTNLEPFIMVASTGLESLFFNCHLQIVESGNLDKRFSCTFSLLKVNGPCPPEDHQNI